MKTNVIFYEDPNSKDCDVFGVFHYKSDAQKWLDKHGWRFNSDHCVWYNSNYRGFVEILERDFG